MASIELDRMLWPPTHPYSWPTIGSMEDLTAARYEDIVAFFKTYYAPNNASLVIAGDIDVSRTRELVERWFGEVPRTRRHAASGTACRPYRDKAQDPDRSGAAATTLSGLAHAARIRPR